MVVIAIFRVIKAPLIDGNLSIIDCYAEAVHVFRNFVHVIKNRLVGAPVHVIEKTVHVHENCCSRVLRILISLEAKLLAWLNQHSLIQILDWFRCVDYVAATGNASASKWTTETTRRDQLFLKMLGVK